MLKLGYANLTNEPWFTRKHLYK